MGHVAAEFLPERLCVVRINLGVIASTRDRDVGHAAVEQILSAKLGVHMNEDTVGSLSLAGQSIAEARPVSRPRFARRVRGRRALTLVFAPRLIIQLSGGCQISSSTKRAPPQVEPLSERDLGLEKDDFKQAFSYEHENHYL